MQPGTTLLPLIGNHAQIGERAHHLFEIAPDLRTVMRRHIVGFFDSNHTSIRPGTLGHGG